MLYTNITTSTIFKASDENPRNSEATMIKLAGGDLLIAWIRFEESPKGSGDSAPSTISEARSSDGGITWSDPEVVVPRPTDAVNVYSPNFLRLSDGSIALFYMKYTQLEAGKPQRATIIMLVSRDEGLTFSYQRTILDHQPIMMSSDCIRRLSCGRIIIPTTHANGLLWSQGNSYHAQCMYSDDDGVNWTISPHKIELPMRGVMEPFIAELADGRLVMVMRNQLGSLFRAYSADGGANWTKPQTTGLSIPESCPFITNIPKSGGQLVFWNNAEYDMRWRSHFGKRTPLTVAATYDGAQTFGVPKNVEDDPGWAYSNPGGMWLNDDTFLLSYWAVPYREDWVFAGHIDLKLASIKINREKLEK